MTDARSAKDLRPSIGRNEFIALVGMLFATVAFSIDAMLPSLPRIAEELTPDHPTLAQLIITSFVLGMGIGTFVAGPVSDAIGRRRVIFIGAALYIAGALWAYLAQSLEMVLVARVAAGIGAAGPRIVTMAIVRDLYSGRTMAMIVSFAMMVFTVFPAVAPLIGDAIIMSFGWRAIFLAFILFSAVSVGWFWLRLPETLAVEARRPLDGPTLWGGLREALSHRQMQLSIFVQMLIFGALFGTISSIQQVFDLRYGQGESFPLWFFFIAVLAFPMSPINGVLVMRFGMRPLIRRACVVAAIAALIYALIAITGVLGELELWAYFFWAVTLFSFAAFTLGNLNALALEPLGHISGLAASLMGGLSTVGGAVLGAAVGQLFDGTAVPLAFCVAGLAAISGLVMLKMPREQI